MATEQIQTGYVIAEDGTVLVQIPDNDPSNRWGFYLADDDNSWPGGFGVASEWEMVADDDPRITDGDRDRLGWILEEARS